MGSLVEGYNYDIFISYRQKDNKYDGWITEFVENLKKELEATFKEEISVYFDINPHDGLLETHDVDESLKEKLKCLVFIPIISRTYCDPKSFAWEHEFKAFVEHASKEELGLKVKLPNGNVASRVLPVQIHELETDDKKLLESVLGGFLRGIEFIYKEPGVNRPLTSKDHEERNLNKTIYRNQINKVSLAINDIFAAIKHKDLKPETTSAELSGSISRYPKNSRMKILTGSFITLLLIIAGILFIPKLIKSEESPEKSIAVLPFKNDSPDQERMYFINGTMEAILNNLCKIKDLRVPGRTSVELYRNNLKPIQTIARELNVRYILEGSGHRDGNRIRLFVQLIDGKEDKHIWSKTYDSGIEEIFSMETEIAQMVANAIEATITTLEKEHIERIPTSSLEAYDYYLKGKDYVNRHNRDEDYWLAIKCYEKAINLDVSFALAYSALSEVYYLLTDYAILSPVEAYPKASEFAIKALKINDELADSHCMLALVKQSFDYDFKAAEKEYIRALEIDPENYYGNYYYSIYLSILDRHEEAIKYANISLELEPLSFQAKFNCYLIQYQAGRKSEARRLMENLRDSYPENPYGYWFCAVFYTDQGMYDEALSMLKTQIGLMKDDNISDEIGLQGYLYGALGLKDKAMEQLKILDALSSEGYYVAPRSRVWIYLGINDINKAVEILDQSFKDHTFEPLYLSIYPSSLIEKDPRFIELRKKVGLLKAD